MKCDVISFENRGSTMLIDSHAHLDMEAFDGDREQVIERALEGGMTHVITVGADLSSSLKAIQLAHNHAFIYATIGYHPHNAKNIRADDLKELERLASDPKVVAWGEIGLDFFKRHSPPDLQVEVFRRQLEIAYHLRLPVIVHDRDAHREILTVLQEMKYPDHKGVIHCFSGDYDLASAFIRMGFHISIPGTVTYSKASQIQDVAARMPMDSMLIETDAPYLAPVPKRGKRNEPLFVTYTAQKIAHLRNMDVEHVTQRTAENAIKLFILPGNDSSGKSHGSMPSWRPGSDNNSPGSLEQG